MTPWRPEVAPQVEAIRAALAQNGAHPEIVFADPFAPDASPPAEDRGADVPPPVPGVVR